MSAHQHMAPSAPMLSRAFCYPDDRTADARDELEDAEAELAKARAEQDRDFHALWCDEGMSLPVLWRMERSLLWAEHAEARVAQARRGVQIAEGLRDE